MLESISIKNLGIIREAEVTFGSGLTAITGETGAGKTMVLSALHLLRGKKASAGSVGSFGESLQVESAWQIGSMNSALTAASDAGGEIEDGELLIHRSVQSSGKSKSVVGGCTTPAGVLGRVADELVNIHGQSDQIKLKSSDAQLAALDRLGGATHRGKMDKFSTAYKVYRKLKKALEESESSIGDRMRTIQKLEEDIQRFDAISPEPGEDAELRSKIERLEHLSVNAEVFANALVELQGDEDSSGVDQSLQNAANTLRGIAGDNIREELTSAAEAALDAVDALVLLIEQNAGTASEDDFEELREAEDREVEITALLKYFWVDTLDELIDRHDANLEQHTALTGVGSSIEEQREAVSAAEATMNAAAEALSESRRKLAAKLESKVNAELAQLAMKSSSLVIDFQENETVNSSGRDTISFLLRNGGGKTSPIGTSASGGELSRIMLALEVVLAEGDSGKTIVFDEVDSGVGGSTAIEIGRRLALLARQNQVIVVTHLPQVAVFADSHVYVEKNDRKTGPDTTVVNLDATARTREIARMLSGLADSDTGLAHAKELEELASSFKSI